MSSFRLGRGLDALLTKDSLSEENTPVCRVAIDALVPNLEQPRKTMTDEGLEELADSIRNQGIIQPLLVRPMAEACGKYQIIAGERRWRAAQKARLKEVPVYVRELSDNDVMLIALMENLQREDLNPAEEAMALQDIKDKLSLTQEELAARIGKSRSQIANSLRLLQLPQKALTCLQTGEISAGHARCLLGFAQEPLLADQFLKYILDRKLTVRSCEDILAVWKKDKTVPWTDTEAPQKSKARAARPAAFRRIEKNFSSCLNIKAKLSGTAESGKLTLTYKSEDQLRQLLNAFGVEKPQT